MRRLFPIRRRHDRGAVIPMTALALTVLMTMTAFAIDLGRMRTERRDLQADADAIALDAVQMVSGMPAGEARPAAFAEAVDSAARNDLRITLEPGDVVVGTWNHQIHDFEPATSDDQVVDAVEVILTGTVEMFFDFSTDSRSVTRRAVAVASGATRGQIGSVLAGLEQSIDPMTAPCKVDQQASFMNAIYGSLLGIDTAVTITGSVDVESPDCELSSPPAGLRVDAASWRGLGYGRVNLDDVASEMGLASKDELFAGTVDAREFLQASAAVLQASPDVLDVQAGGILGTIATAMANTAQVNLADIIDAGTGNESSAADASVDALTILTGTAMLIDDDSFFAVDVPLALPYVNGSVVRTKLHVVQPPQTHFDYRSAGQPGPRTAQVRLAVEVPLRDVILDFGLVGGLLAGLGVQTTTGSLNFVVEVGRADATYDRIDCPAGGPTSVTMSVDTGAVTMAYGVAGQTQLVQSETVDVDASSQINGTFGVNVPLVGPVGIDFDQVTRVEETQTYMTALDAAISGAGNVNILGAEAPHTFLDYGADTPWHRYPGGITGTTLADHTYAAVQYNSVLGSTLSLLGLSQLSLHNLIRTALDPIVDDLGVDIIEPLLSSLGITVAGADGRILDVTCQMPALANRD
jgi:uncharacterized membrane protein